MCTVSFNIPNEFLTSRRIDTKEASAYARLMFAVGAYLKADVTLEDAAQLAATDVATFKEYIDASAHHDYNSADLRMLLSELEKGRLSGEEQGYIPSKSVRERLRVRLEAKRA